MISQMSAVCDAVTGIMSRRVQFDKESFRYASHPSADSGEIGKPRDAGRLRLDSWQGRLSRHDELTRGLSDHHESIDPLLIIQGQFQLSLQVLGYARSKKARETTPRRRSSHQSNYTRQMTLEFGNAMILGQPLEVLCTFFAHFHSWG